MSFPVLQINHFILFSLSIHQKLVTLCNFIGMQRVTGNITAPPVSHKRKKRSHGNTFQILALMNAIMPICTIREDWGSSASPSLSFVLPLFPLFHLVLTSTCRDCTALLFHPHALFSVSQEVLSTTETALAMNRYIGSALLPLLTRCAALFGSTEHRAQLVDSTLQTIYRLSKGRSLTKAQRDSIEDCLLAICK